MLYIYTKRKGVIDTKRQENRHQHLSDHNRLGVTENTQGIFSSISLHRRPFPSIKGIMFCDIFKNYSCDMFFS